jgi:NAD(P)H-nitrite reductase large subunit
MLREAIRERRLASVAEIGDVLRAGTNSGSCIPEPMDLLCDARSGGNASVAA